MPLDRIPGTDFSNLCFVAFKDVCYLRLDFESFNILGPSTSDESVPSTTAPIVTMGTSGGSCSRDSFRVTVRISSNLEIFVTLGKFGLFQPNYSSFLHSGNLKSTIWVGINTQDINPCKVVQLGSIKNQNSRW